MSEEEAARKWRRRYWTLFAAAGAGFLFGIVSLWPIAGVLWAAAGFALLGAGAIAARDIGGMAKELGDIRDSWAERAYGGYVPAFRGPAFGRLVGVAYLFGGAILVVLGVGLIVVH